MAIEKRDKSNIIKTIGAKIIFLRERGINGNSWKQKHATFDDAKQKVLYLSCNNFL